MREAHRRSNSLGRSEAVQNIPKRPTILVPSDVEVADALKPAPCCDDRVVANKVARVGWQLAWLVFSEVRVEGWHNVQPNNVWHLAKEWHIAADCCGHRSENAKLEVWLKRHVPIVADDP